MSDYVHNKQVLYPVKEELLRALDIEDVFELKLPSNSKFRAEGFVDYDVTRNFNQYLAYELYSDYGEETGEFGRSRLLRPSEQEKYKQLFRQVIPEELIDPSLFRYVDYCWYNGCECQDYYVTKDAFEDEI